MLERPECRAATGEADDGVENEIGLAGFEQRNEVSPALEVLDSELGGEPG